jgi:hypothetical protein
MRLAKFVSKFRRVWFPSAMNGMDLDKRDAANARWRQFYARNKAGRQCVQVEIDAAFIELLVTAELLSPDLIHDKGAIAEACTKMNEIILMEKSK